MNVKKQTTEVLQKVQEPSKENLNTYERIGVASGGALLSYIGIKNMRRGWPLAVIGGALAIAGIAGKNPLYLVNNRSKKHLKVKTSILINKEKGEVYDFWRKLENLPTFMKHLKEVRELNDKKSHWKAELEGVDIEWDAEITRDIQGQRIGWRSLPGSEVQTTGQVEFRDAAGNKATQLTVTLEYADQTGKIAKAFASMYHPVFKDQIEDELNECKRILETRKVQEPKTQPHGHG
ncbi:hypothetical protein C900_00173 [Fulvivirga imtechensis AK7]|uniref:Coenzyme Q-binding protein COQ10 START domain-containing protein n=1 Tax=Fulvivirga imtechensis AK7 TaxID=1237149 RepID=L8JM77_9BACT|nr:SRPBCC family protein [Fulvivirga imtechensis]ELR68629.1 hypothetical protein C900_00173 [Fulvivirga imtechensis AK7]